MGVDEPSEPTEAEIGGARRIPLDFRVGITLMVVVLSVAVVVLALTDSGGTKTETKTTVVTKTVADTALRREVGALGKRLDNVHDATGSLSTEIAHLNATVKSLEAGLAQLHAAAPTGAQLARLESLNGQLQTVHQCLFQVQKQLDDLQGYALTRKALHKRVSGTCLQILQPRFAGR